MRVLNKIRFFFAGMILCILLFLVGPEGLRIWLGLVLLALAAAGWFFSAGFLKLLERGLEILPDQQKFEELFCNSKEPILQKIVEKERNYFQELEKVYTMKVEDKQSKINSLQSQINPHFLYNTLECIRSEAIFRGCDSIANMAKSLAAFFRYSISRAENIVTVSDELNNIRNYIMIQNYRFEDKFQFRVEIEDGDKEVLSCLIPKMTIQPIVENAVFHGLETKQGDCCVCIHVRTTEDTAILVISDSGVGMNEEQLCHLRFSMEHGRQEEEPAGEEKHKLSRRNGIALYNVNQRLKLSFGPSYGLNVYSIEGEGTDMEIILPIRTEREEE